MNLISCNGCGVVLNKDKLVFPEIWDKDGTFIDGTATWGGDKFVPITKCPVCGGEIPEEGS